MSSKQEVIFLGVFSQHNVSDFCRAGKEYLRNGGAGTSMPAMMHASQPRNLTTYRYEKKREGLRRPERMAKRWVQGCVDAAGRARQSRNKVQQT